MIERKIKTRGRDSIGRWLAWFFSELSVLLARTPPGTNGSTSWENFLLMSWRPISGVPMGQRMWWSPHFLPPGCPWPRSATVKNLSACPLQPYHCQPPRHQTLGENPALMTKGIGVCGLKSVEGIPLNLFFGFSHCFNSRDLSTKSTELNKKNKPHLPSQGFKKRRTLGARRCGDILKLEGPNKRYPTGEWLDHFLAFPMLSEPKATEQTP